MSLIDQFETTVSVELPGGRRLSLRRMTLRMWAKLAAAIRDEAIAVELKAINAQRDPITQQNMRMRAMQFEPSYYGLIDHARTPSGIERVLTFCATEAGVDAADVQALPDALSPDTISALMDQLIHAPLGPRIGGNVSEGQSSNPTDAGTSGPAIGASEPTPGDASPSSSTGNGSPASFEPTTRSTQAI